jgi:hypothetical protein
MTAVNKTNKIKIETQEEDTAFGKHSRVPFQLDNIDSKA